MSHTNGKIDARTKVVAVLGHPVEHSLSPVMHNAAFRALDMNWVYVAFDVAPDGLAEAVRGARALGLAGLNLTVSLKEAAARIVDRLDDSARRLRSVNTIKMATDAVVGYSTDGTGFVRSVEEDLDMAIEHKDVVVLGAGGAAAAIVTAAVDAGARTVTIVNRTFDRAVRLRETVVQGTDGACPVEVVALENVGRWEGRADLVVNATSLGWRADDPIPVPSGFVREGMAVLDTCYNPAGTPLLEEARRCGVPSTDGLGMLVHQGAASFEIWTGRSAPVDVMKQALLAKGR